MYAILNVFRVHLAIAVPKIEVKKFQDISPRNYFDELNFSVQ